MTDYTQELAPPDYRNLALNPSGEITYAAAFFASNGVVLEGDDTVAASLGDGTATYTVTQTSALPYHFGPLGPIGEVHRGAFKIPNSGRVSGTVKVRRGTPTGWVCVQARFMTWDGTQLIDVGTVNLGSATQLTTSYQQITVRSTLAQRPAGATHWRMVLAVTATNPALTNPTPPSVGMLVYSDEWFVTDSGEDLTGVTYVDGDQTDCYWEGDPYYSTSRTGVLPDPPDPDPIPDNNAEDGALDPPSPDNSIDDEDDVVDDTPAPLPPSVEATEIVRSSIEVAREIVGWRYSPQNLCLKADIQIGNLRLNTIDDSDTLWIVNDIEGWWTLPEPDVPDLPRGWGDGSYEARGRYGARLLTITGTFIPKHPNDVAYARDRLIRAIDLCHRGDWFLTHEDSTPARTLSKGSKVWLSGQPSITTLTANGKTDFQIGLRAPDPVKYHLLDGVPPGYQQVTLLTYNVEYPGYEYGPDSSTLNNRRRTYPRAYPQSVFGNNDGTLINNGNTEVFPYFTIAGPTGGPLQIRNSDTGQELRIVKKLHAGEVLEIDCATKQVTLNGVGNFRLYLDIDADWIYFKPGANRIYFIEETPGAGRSSMNVRWRSGWIG